MTVTKPICIKFILVISLMLSLKSFAQSNLDSNITDYHAKALNSYSLDSTYFFNSLKAFEKQKINLDKKEKIIIDEIANSLTELHKDRIDSSLSICYNLLYGEYNLSPLDSVMIYNQIGEIYYNLGEFATSKKFFSTALNILERNKLNIDYTVKQIYSIFYNTNELDSAITYVNKSLKNKLTNKLDAYINLGVMYRENEQYDLSKKYYQKAQELSPPPTKNDIRFINYGLGEIFYQQKNIDSALIYYKKVVQDTIAIDNWFPYINSNVRISEIYTDLEMYDSSTFYMDRFFLCPCLDNETKIWLNEVKADYYYKINDLENYQKYFKIADKYKDTVIETLNNNINTLSEVNSSKMKVIEENLKIRSENNKVIKQKNSAYFWLILLLILLFIIATIFYVFRSKKNKQLYRIKQELSEAKINEMKAVEENLKLEVKHKNQDLSQLATNMVLKRDFLIEQKDRLNELIKLDGDEIKRSLKRYLNDFNTYESIDNNLTTLQGDIQKINNKLNSKLKEKYPSLTDNDIQIIILHLLKLNTKEIAVLRNVTPKAIQISRYRIKKKMGLDKDDDIVTYIEREML